MEKIGQKESVFLGLWLLLVATVFVWSSARYFTFWGDEVYSVLLAKKGFGEFLVQYAVQPDSVHPPLYYILLNVWQKMLHITDHRDYLYSLFSVGCYVAAIIFCYRVFLNNLRERFVFLLLVTFSAYFFVYSHMVRYYTLAALVYLVAFHFFLRWLGDKSTRRFLYWFVATVILLYTDYPSFFLFACTAGIFFWRDAHYKINKQLIIQVCVAVFLFLLSMAPLLYLNFFHGLIAEASHSGGRIHIISSLIKFCSGLILVPYHMLVGEFFHPVFTPIIFLALIGIGGLALRSYKQSDRKVQENVKALALFGIVNSIVCAALLSTIIKVYPIFSFSRFLLATAFLLYVVLAKLLSRNQFATRAAIVLLVGLNISTFYNNIHKQYFINPIYFFPKEMVQEISLKYPDKIIINGERGVMAGDASAYFLSKQFPDRLVLQDEIKPGRYLIFFEPRLYESIDDVRQLVQTRYGVDIVEYGGYDNISAPNKQFMKERGFIKSDYKYYYFVVVKKALTT